ncbi:hypothetical protein Y1Q_0012813 [Alligator mississippiensis]|uniref:Uncharacterized protein n=1 Tax=Alligator mississippiensis TaxID=8496 RepID=A0A151NR80_ALLMI|nr:hypothetical protein Y1Q_0012813 [Alligator mississippiensis]
MTPGAGRCGARTERSGSRTLGPADSSPPSFIFQTEEDRLDRAQRSVTDAGDALTEDDVYCRCLSKTLCYTSTPVTVGFYAPCGQRLHSMLDKITASQDDSGGRLQKEAGGPGLRCGD